MFDNGKELQYYPKPACFFYSEEHAFRLPHCCLEALTNAWIIYFQPHNHEDHLERSAAESVLDHPAIVVVQ
jgi:hypothetical protein